MKDVENRKTDAIKIAAREMLKGSKMLGEHCKVCGFPLFEDSKGNRYCVYCRMRGERSKSDKIEGGKKENKTPLYIQHTYIEVVDRKVEYLFKRLDEEYDIARIVEITDAIKLLLKLKSKLK